MRLAAYAGTSVALAAAIVLKALHSRPNFYSVCVYFSESNAALMILSNLVLLVIGSLLVGLQHILYGPLRPIETEQLYEKAWFAVTETCLAMTIFREDLGVWFVVMFVALLVAKVWGWIGEGRLDILEQQPPENPRLFHARLSTSLLLSMLFNVWLLNYSVDTVRRTNRANMMIMFAFEFALLNVSSLSTLVRYGITVQEALIVRDQTNTALQDRRKELEQQRKAAREAAAAAGEPAPEEIPIEELLDEADIDVPGWEEKSRWIFYLDLTTDFLRLVLYITFFAVLCKLYGMPIHIIRDVAMVARSFYRRVTDFIKYRHATRDMHARYPDATAEEITTQDVCIICREGMTARPETTAQDQAETATPSPMDERLRPKKLPCGHILHFACLRSWLERQQNCPTCRQPVLSNPTPPQPARGANAPANNNVAGAQAQANANPVPAANAVQPNAQLNRMRTFNLGPLRLTVGTGRIIQGPQAGINQPNQPQIPDANTSTNNTILSPTPNIQSSGPPGLSSLPESNSSVIQASINHLERMLTQDMARLRLQTEQMNVLRAWQAEMTRLRTSQGVQLNVNPIFATGSTTPTFPPHGISVSPMSTFTADHTSEPIRSGSANFPNGVTIPEGWTLLPLQRLQEQTVPQPIVNPTVISEPQQRSRSLGPSSQPLPSMNITSATSNLSSSPVQRPLSTPSPIPILTTTNTSSSTPAQVNQIPSENQQPGSNHLEVASNPGSEAVVGTIPSELPSNKAETQEASESTTESSNTGGWQWPTSPSINTPTSTASPKLGQESSQRSSLSIASANKTGDVKDHVATVEDVSEEEQEEL